MANALTLSRILATPFVVWMIATASATGNDGRHAWALGIFMAAALTDFVDGQVARRTGSITEFGRVVDPLADRVLVIATLVALMARSFMPLWMGLVIAGRDAAMLAGGIILGIKDTGNIKVHWIGKMATGGLFIAICIFVFFNHRGYVHPVGLLFYLPSILLSYIAGFIYFKRGIKVISKQSKDEAAMGGAS